MIDEIMIHGKKYHVGDKVLIVDHIPEEEGIEKRYLSLFQNILNNYCTITKIGGCDIFYVENMEKIQSYNCYLTQRSVSKVEYILPADIEPLDPSGFYS